MGLGEGTGLSRGRVGSHNLKTSKERQPDAMSSSWRHLEQRVAEYFERNGYTAKANQHVQGRSGLAHEIDVLAERRDAAGLHRVVVECKAWQSAVDKDVVYKLLEVMRDAGLSKGIIVSAGGMSAGARVAAAEAHVEMWGPDEIRHHLGDDALAGLPLAVPDTAIGAPVRIDAFTAEREIRKARGGFAGIGTEDVASINMVWIPCFEFQLAITRVRPGLVKDREELVRRWTLFEALAGRLVGWREGQSAFEPVQLDAPVIRQQRSAAQVLAVVRKTLAKHRNARTDAAEIARQGAYNAVGLPGSTREFAVEDEQSVVVPFYIGTLRRKTSERFVAVSANTGQRIESVERALHEKVDVLRRALTDAEAKVLARPDRRIAETPTCACGAPMVLRRRAADGERFWGCSTFPRCRQTQPMA